MSAQNSKQPVQSDDKESKTMDTPRYRRSFLHVYKWHIFFVLLLISVVFYYKDDICDYTNRPVDVNRRIVSVLDPYELRYNYDASIGTPTELRRLFR